MSEARRQPRPRPVPVADPETAPFWDAANEGRLVLQRCTSCGAAQLYPRPHCVVCRGPVEWEEASGRATVVNVPTIPGLGNAVGAIFNAPADGVSLVLQPLCSRQSRPDERYTSNISRRLPYTLMKCNR